jgi:hypothetical protein
VSASSQARARWAGGAGVSDIKRAAKGIRIFSTIQESVSILENMAHPKQTRVS